MINEVTIWFNHWFSSAYRIIELMKRGVEKDNSKCINKLYIIGSNRNENCVYKGVCDEFYIEDAFLDTESDEYVDWCIKFCKEHSVNVFVPKDGMVNIVKNLDKFKSIGVRVLSSDNYNYMRILNDKKLTADYFKLFNICKVTPMYVVNTCSEFRSAYSKLRLAYPGDRVCFKYSKGEGATSFRVIDDKMSNIESLSSSVGAKISFKQADEILNSVSKFNDIIVMPYLDGEEVSIDAISFAKGKEMKLLCVPRIKHGRVTEINFDTEVMDIAYKFAKESGYSSNFNIQLKKWHGEWYIIEVNTRMSGGIHMCEYAGLNLPYLGLRKIFDLDQGFTQTLSNALITQVETPIVLKSSCVIINNKYN